MTAHWGVPDPAAVRGSEAEVQRAFKDAFFTLERRIGLFLCLPLAALNGMAIKKNIEEIGKS
jgi:arsenate reductase